MRPFRFLRPVPAVLTGLLLTLPAPTARGQGKAVDPVAVDIPTADFVELKAHFYPAPPGKLAPAVLLLHALGEDSKKAEWINLAKALQAKGYAVLRFDFRGHGDSTEVSVGNPMLNQPGFWSQMENRNGIRTKDFKTTTINYKQFMPGYHRILANDVAAAKAFLDAKNDAGECNSGNLILIGAKEGATIGTLWLNGEYSRYRLVQDPMFPNRSKPDLANPEGKCVSAAVWLSLNSTLGGQNVSAARMLYKSGALSKTPMAFFYAKGDPKGKQVAVGCEKFLTKLDKKTYPFTLSWEVPTPDKLAGAQLLLKSLGQTKQILDYLDKALEEKNPKAKVRMDKNDIYVWYLPGPAARPVISRPRMAELPVFATYRSFLAMP